MTVESPANASSAERDIGLEQEQVSASPASPEGHAAGSSNRKRDFRGPVWLTWLGYALFVVLLGANVYTIVELGMGVS